MSNIDEIIGIVFNHPLTYILIIIVGLYFIINQINKGRLKPEQHPDFGVKFRAKRVKEHLAKRAKSFAIKPKKAFLFRDVHRIGKILSIEDIPDDPKTLYAITYRRFGFVNALVSALGFGRQQLLVDDQHLLTAFQDDTKEIHYIINKNIFFRERGGMMMLSGKAEKKFIDEINTDRDYENAKGFVSDFPRRLSNLNPSHAIHGDTLETEQQLEEKSKSSFLSRFKKGG